MEYLCFKGSRMNFMWGFQISSHAALASPSLRTWDSAVLDLIMSHTNETSNANILSLLLRYLRRKVCPIWHIGTYSLDWFFSSGSFQMFQSNYSHQSRLITCYWADGEEYLNILRLNQIGKFWSNKYESLTNIRRIAQKCLLAMNF